MVAFGYVRKSVMRDDTTLSPVVQEQRVRALAASKGDDDIEILRDLDISGAKVEERPNYVRLVEAIESGEAHAVYAFDLSRLHRNTKESLRFFELAEKHNVAVTLVEGNIDTRGPTGTLVLTVLAAMNAWTSQITSAKIKATFALKRERNEPLGGRRYGEVRESKPAKDGTTRMLGVGEDPEAVVGAFRDTRNTVRAARILNAAGVPTRNGASRGWAPSAVLAVVTRLAPDLIDGDPETTITRQGSKRGERAQRFARLLRCSTCEGMLTPTTDRNGVTRYYCSRSRIVEGHARYAVSEAALMPAMIDALERTKLLERRLRRGTTIDEATAEQLEARQRRVIDLAKDGIIERVELDAELATIRAEMKKLNVLRWVRQITRVPSLDEDDATTVNAYLRRVFDHFIVDMTTPPHRGKTVASKVTPVWHDPSMAIEYADEEATA